MGPVQQDLNAGMRCIKYMLFLFNLLFVLTGILVITVAVSINAIYYNYIEFLDSKYLPPTTLLIIIGFIIFFVAFFGCCGALRESTCMIMVFSVMLGIIFVLEFSAAIAAYVLQDGLSEMLSNNINATMLEYPNNHEAQDTIDFLQSQLGCCGIREPGDWGFIDLSGLNTTILYNGNSIPDSCCVENISVNSFCFTAGCLSHLEFLISQSSLLLATAAMSIALLQLLGVAFGCSLARSIRVHKTERLRRYQEMREQLINSYSMMNASDVKTRYPVVYMDYTANQSKC